MEMYEVCLIPYGWDDKIGTKVCKTKEDAELEFINLVYENCDELNSRSYINESYIEKIEVYTDKVTRRFPDIMLFSIFTDSGEYKYFEDFYDDIETSITKESDKKIEENTDIIKIEIWYNEDDNNDIDITFGVDTTNCKTLEDIFDEARNQLNIILNTYDISKFALMNKEEIIESKFIPTDEYEDFYVKYCNI